VKKYTKKPKKIVKGHQEWVMPIPFVLCCDMQSRPDDAAYDVLIGKEIFDNSTPWRLPAQET
jgi:hypothetical protein